jgi:hypothetical protein
MITWTPLPSYEQPAQGGPQYAPSRHSSVMRDPRGKVSAKSSLNIAEHVGVLAVVEQLKSSTASVGRGYQLTAPSSSPSSAAAHSYSPVSVSGPTFILTACSPAA